MLKSADKEKRARFPILKGWYFIGHLMDGRHHSYAAVRDKIQKCLLVAFSDNDYRICFSINLKLSEAGVQCSPLSDVRLISIGRRTSLADEVQVHRIDYDGQIRPL